MAGSGTVNEQKQSSGAYLLNVGLIVPLSTEYTQNYPSRVFHLK